jgi:hypothetical protein
VWPGISSSSQFHFNGQTPFYQLIQGFCPASEAVHEERYQERYGFWRPIVRKVVRKLLE